MKNVYILTIIIFIIVIPVIIFAHSTTVDTKYAIEYSRVFGSYDIKKVDKYLNEDTMITYDGKTDSYKNLRVNVINAFEEKLFNMPSGASYGHGYDLFVNRLQTIGIQAYIKSEKYSSEYVSMVLERKWFILYSVKSITSKDDFFGYLFFGINNN